MGQSLACAMLWAVALGGCSLIYNPSNIRAARDAGVDGAAGPADAPEVIVDADPAALTLSSVEPSAIWEGQGIDGSRDAVLVVHGNNIISDATVSIGPKNAGDTPMVTSVPGAEVVAIDHHMIAVPVVAAENTACNTGMTLDLVITVTQSGGAVTQTIPWTLDCLDQVDSGGTLNLAGGADPLPGTYQYSHVDASSVPKPAGNGPVIVRVTGGITITAGVDVSAAGSTPGPGGKAAGQGDGKGGAGGPNGAILGGGDGGGGAGYAQVGTDGDNNSMSGGKQVGTALIASYADDYASGGGNADGAGGAGGGTIELSAGGKVTVAAITATGGNGTAGSCTIPCPGGWGAGGGAGGTIVLRGSTVEVDGNLDASGGAGGAGKSNGSGGAGSVGRIRIDGSAAPTLGSGVTIMPLYHRGLALDSQTPYVTNSANPTIAVDGKPGDVFDIYTLDATRAIKDMELGVTMSSARTTIQPQVHWGFNTICVVATGAAVTTPEAGNCIDLAFLP